MRRGFQYILVRYGLTGIDIASILHKSWDKWSRKCGAPLNYIVVHPDTGDEIKGSTVNKIIRELAERFMPDPSEADLIQARSFRRCSFAC